jgi:hypothetical protein
MSTSMSPIRRRRSRSRAPSSIARKRWGPTATMRFEPRSRGSFSTGWTGRPPSEILSAIGHMGWGAEDMPASYQKQVAAGTRFETPSTDISDLVGQAAGKFFVACVDDPSHELIELNTANHHQFGHLHLLSADPIAAAEWYHEHLGLPIVGRQAKKANSPRLPGCAFRVGPGRQPPHHYFPPWNMPAPSGHPCGQPGRISRPPPGG